MTAVFGVTGWKNTGKTTLVSKLVAEFTKRGVRVSTIKHAHSGFEVDQKGTDSHQHRLAGAQEVTIVSENRWALIHEVQSTGAAPTLETMLAKLAPCELILVEGYKSSGISKIECRRNGAAEPPIWHDNESIVAVACETKEQTSRLPQFDLNDITAIADYIGQTTGLGL